MHNGGAMRIAIIAATITLTAIAGFLLTCSQPTGSDFRSFRVRIDSLKIPESLSHEDTLHIQLYGTIGLNSHYSFSHFEADRDSFKLELGIWGKQYTGGLNPYPIAVYLDTIYSVYPLYPGLFQIEIQQILRDSVVVW